jgi:hypothetical protein
MTLLTNDNFVLGTRMTLEEHEALLSKLTPAERKIHDWYQQFDADYAEKLRANYGIHCTLVNAIQGCNVRELAWELQRAVSRRAWEDMPEFPGNAIQGKVLHLSFIEWVTSYLHTSIDELMRIMSGQLPDADKAGEAAIAMIDAMHAEDPDALKALMHSAPDSNLPGWRQLIDNKAKECDGKWTEASTHLSDITAGKVGGNGNNQYAKSKPAPDAGLLDPTRDARSRPTNERERMRIRLRGLKDDPEKCKELGITTKSAQAAFDVMCRNANIPLAEVSRIAGFKQNPRKRIELSGALSHAQVADKLINFFGRDKAAAIAASLTTSLTS